MDARRFLELLLPLTGVIFTAAPAGKGWANTSHESIDSAVNHVNALVYSGNNAYFALSTYAEARVWNADKQRWQSRTQENAQFVKSFFLDLDVDPADPNKFDSKSEALLALRDFVKEVGLPRPMLVDSGGGIHAYWPLAQAVTTLEWRPVADLFKAVCLAQKFRADRSLTSDQARVLRVLGTWNFRRGMPVRMLYETAPVGFSDFAQRLHAFAEQVGLQIPPRASIAGAPLPGRPADPFDVGNLGVTNDPLNFDRVVFSCPQLQLQACNRGATTGEQLWRAALGLAKFSEPLEPAWRLVSDGHPDFSPAATLQKLNNWNTGPTTCEHFHQLSPTTCESCPHFGRITSPAQLGRIVHVAPPKLAPIISPGIPQLQLPDPPHGYSRRKSDNAIVLESEDQNGAPVFEVVCPYDLYPLALRAQTGDHIDENSRWRAHLPLKRGAGREVRDIDVPLGMLADTKALAKHLFSKGIILNGDQPRNTQMYMSAYLQKLADAAGREKLYERLGWHDDHSTFVLGDRVLHRDGTVQPHVASRAIRNTTRDGLRTAGSLQGWQDAMRFYNRPGYEGHRFFLYVTLGAPIFHMNDTGNKGVLVAASGETGRGKTTCLKACSSIWGSLEALIVNGNKDGATTNALYATLGTLHSIPMMVDDITERDPDEIRKFALNAPQGQGKRRLTADAVQSERMDTWETPILITTNSDEISNIVSSGGNVNPHLMRIMNVDFARVDQGAEAKIAADEFLRALNANYGHVGPAMMKVIVPQYEVVRKGYIKNVAMVDRLLGSANASAERYWSATVAAAYTGAQLAARMGLIDFPIEADLQWMVQHVGNQREAIREFNPDPMENLAAFLNASLRGTLILSAKASSNLDNVIHRPTDDLIVRNELDHGITYVSRAAIMHYCSEKRIPFRAFEAQLEKDRVVLQHNCQKVLGADTSYRGGQIRCWKVDASILGASVQLPPVMPSNVIPLQAGVRK